MSPSTSIVYVPGPTLGAATTWPSPTAYSLASRLPSLSKMPRSRSSEWSEGYVSATARVIEWVRVHPAGALRVTSVRWQPLLCSHTGAGGPSTSGLPGPTLPSYVVDAAAAPPTPTVGGPAACAATAVSEPPVMSRATAADVQARAPN